MCLPNIFVIKVSRQLDDQRKVVLKFFRFFTLSCVPGTVVVVFFVYALTVHNDFLQLFYSESGDVDSDRFLRNNAAWLGAGILIAFSSSFGQTYFIALFAEPLRVEFSLSHGEWGSLYTVATFCSALALVQFGKAADLLRVRSLALIILAGLVVLAVAMAKVNSVVLLAGIIFGLRFCGQGMMTHIAITAMGRWFTRRRGRAVAVASLGFPIGEAALPAIAVGLMAAVGWRDTWLIVAALLVVVVAPVIFFLLRHERKPGDDSHDFDASGMQNRHWSRSEVIKHWFFWALAPGLMASPFISTALFFHQVHIVETKGWTMAGYVLAFPVYSASSLLFSFVCGAAVDRYGSIGLLRVFLLPLSVALIVLGMAEPLWMAFLYMALLGMTNGAAVALVGTLWAEFYGTKHLGAIRAIAVAMMVFGTSLGPGVTGALIDLGIGIETQFFWMAAYTVAISFMFVFVARKIIDERAMV